MCRKSIYLVSFILVLGLVLTSVANALDPSLVAWYKLDGDATDSCSSDLHGTGTEMGDPTYEAGVLGQAINLDGDGDYVDCGNPPEFNVTEQNTTFLPSKCQL
jgi:hypothetical protein